MLRSVNEVRVAGGRWRSLGKTVRVRHCPATVFGRAATVSQTPRYAPRIIPRGRTVTVQIP